VRLFPDAVNRFLNDPASGLESPVSKKGYKNTLRMLQLRYPNHALETFTEDDLVAFCGKDGLSPATKAAYRTRIHGFFSWAQWRGLIDQDPSIHLKRIVQGSFTKPVKEHHWLNMEEVGRVLDTIDTSTVKGRRNMVIARLGFTCGLRRGEIAKLTWNGVNLERQLINVIGKGGKQASLFVTDATLPWLDKWRSEATEGLGREPGPEPVIPAIHVRTDFGTGWYEVVKWETGVSAEGLGKVLEKLRRELGADFRPHDMRRSFANMLQENGASVEEISAALRHSNLGTTARYLERRQDASFQAVKRRGLDV
jgi:integrase/recombinase XerD